MKSLTGIVFAACLCAGPLFSQNGARGSGPPVSFDDSARVRDLLRAGNLYLSLSDALGLAIENNLDVELQRYALPTAGAELLRAKGGGVVRGLNYTLAEVPTGVGGPVSPYAGVPRCPIGACTLNPPSPLPCSTHMLLLP